jgi:hypothetical protein
LAISFSHRYFLFSFSLDEKETKNQGKKMLPCTTSAGLPKAFGIFADPTHAANGIVIFIISFLNYWLCGILLNFLELNGCYGF